MIIHFPKHKHLNHNVILYSAAIILNIFLAYLFRAYQQPFNVDGIIYLNAASATITHGLKVAMEIYSWPFYSILIAATSKATHLSLENSAFFLNILFTSILSVVFIALIKEFGGTLTTQYFALLVILTYPYLNHDRTNILRDLGYYAFFLLSFLLFIYYLRSLNWRSALMWSMSILLATLFRIEGAVILLLAPFTILLLPNLNYKNKILYFLKINTPTIIISLMMAAFVIIHHDSVKQLGRLNEFGNWVNSGFNIITHSFSTNAMLLKQNFLTPFNAGSAYIFLTGGLTALFIETVLGVLGIFYMVLVFYAFNKKLIATNYSSICAYISYLVINLLILIGFLIHQSFLSGRYVLPLCLLLLLAVPFSLSAIYLNTTKNNKWLTGLISILLLITIIDGLCHFGRSKTYIIEAGNWLDKNTAIRSQVYTNDPQLFYYAHRSPLQYPQDFASRDKVIQNLKSLNLKHYDYVALVVRKNEYSTLEQEAGIILNQQPIIIFSNKRGDKALIFKMKNN